MQSENLSAAFAIAARSTTIREPWLKRPLDIVLSSLMLIISAPVWLLIALAIKLEDGGPVFYVQERWGRGGTTFIVRKFRTMIPDSDKRYGILQARANDNRITRVGAFCGQPGWTNYPN